MNGVEYKIKDFPRDNWRWKNFRPEELMSKSDKKLMIDEGSMDKLQAFREILGAPVHLTSAYRSAAHNKRVGGAKGSYHMKAKAYDVTVARHNPVDIIKAGLEAGFTGFGVYLNRKHKFIHLDTGPKRMWSK